MIPKLMIRSLCCLVLGLMCGVLHSQPVTFDTLYTQGHIGYAIMPNSQGYAIAGNHHNEDFWLFQINEQAEIQWEQTYGRRYGLFDAATMYDAAIFSYGYFLTGRSYSIPDTNWGKFFGYVVKVDAQGYEVWDRLFYTTYDSSRSSTFYNVTPTPDGGCLLTGNIFMGYSDTLDAPTRFWIIKLDSLGAVEFEKIYHNGPSNSAYDDGTSKGFVLPNGQGYLIGTTYGFGIQGYLMRLDMNGDTLWTRKYDRLPNHGQGQWAITEDMIALPGGDYLMAMGIFLIRIDSIGNLIWLRSDILAKELTLRSDGNLIAHNGGLIYLISPEGQILWQRSYTDYGLNPVDFIRFVEVVPAQDGGLMVLYNNLSGLGLMKTDCEGNLVNPVACATTSAQNLPAEALRVYPNPSPGPFAIRLDPRCRYELTVTDMAGRVLASELIQNQDVFLWSAASAEAGIYTLRLANQRTGEIQYLRAFKQRAE
jgi:hypothetical protein